MNSISPSRRLRVAVIEDDPLVQMTLKSLMPEHELFIFPEVESFLQQSTRPGSASKNADLILLDLCHPGDPQGLSTVGRIDEIRTHHRGAELVIESGIGEIETMRRCIRAGADKFLLKDHLASELPLLLQRVLEQRDLKQGLDRLIIGESEVMLRLKRELLSLKPQSRSADVLIEGETGTGKELCAQALHSEGPFLAINVSAIPPELFEAEFFGSEKGSYTGSTQARRGHLDAAENGTLFLDEVQSLPPAHQAKLLRVLETRRFTRVGSSAERPFRARVVSAANVSLRDLAARGLFREDLFYRLAGVQVLVPPLRARGHDISLLANHFLKQFDPRQALRFSPAALGYLERSYDWPGNVRELRSLVKTLAMKSPMPILDEPEIREHLRKSESEVRTPATPATSSPGDFAIDWNQSFDENIGRLEKFLLSSALADGRSSAQAREMLQLARSRFYEKIKQYGLMK